MAYYRKDVHLFRRVSGLSWLLRCLVLSKAGRQFPFSLGGWNQMIFKLPFQAATYEATDQGRWGQASVAKAREVTRTVVSQGRQGQGPWLSIASHRSRDNRLKARHQPVSLARVSFYSIKLGWSAWVGAGSAFYRKTRAKASNQSKWNS